MESLECRAIARPMGIVSIGTQGNQRFAKALTSFLDNDVVNFSQHLGNERCSIEVAGRFPAWIVGTVCGLVAGQFSPQHASSEDGCQHLMYCRLKNGRAMMFVWSGSNEGTE
jgi:hypothetical protein